MPCSVYAERGSARLEKHHQKAKILTAFAGTSFYNAHEKSSPSILAGLAGADIGPRRVGEGRLAARSDLAERVKELFRFAQVDQGINSLFEDVNRRHGQGLIGLGYGGLRPGPSWQMKQDFLSPMATTHWDELARRECHMTTPSVRPVAVEFELTIESPDGEQRRVSAPGASNAVALARATELVTEGYRHVIPDRRLHPIPHAVCGQVLPGVGEVTTSSQCVAFPHGIPGLGPPPVARPKFRGPVQL
ncbi:hypothetical protein GCM10023346_37860 [Arthrobacter gyeryongensis]|uniref:DUF4113 domain-containing protein n=1 Tax=Arthrobacter gyeryongensis TaxID=1650592 RepID=A0ABP9SPD4_9MICC